MKGQSMDDMKGTMEANIMNDFNMDMVHSGEMEICIQNCLKCYSSCQETFFHCLQQQGGPCYDLNHLQLLQSCTEICRTSAQMMMLRSPYHHYLCKICAEICKACAESCEELADDDVVKKCAQVCHQCAESCEEMSQSAKSKAV